MTNQEVIEILEHLKPSNQVYTANDAYAVGQALCIAIKSLEQEPILDKIRAEIDNALSDGMIHKKTVLGIIDKYKAESEGT